MLLQSKGNSYLNVFGKLKFQNELLVLRKKIESKCHNKLNQIEEALLNQNEYLAEDSEVCFIKVFIEFFQQYFLTICTLEESALFYYVWH